MPGPSRLAGPRDSPSSCPYTRLRAPELQVPPLPAVPPWPRGCWRPATSRQHALRPSASWPRGCWRPATSRQHALRPSAYAPKPLFTPLHHAHRSVHRPPAVPPGHVAAGGPQPPDSTHYALVHAPPSHAPYSRRRATRMRQKRKTKSRAERCAKATSPTDSNRLPRAVHAVYRRPVTSRQHAFVPATCSPAASNVPPQSGRPHCNPAPIPMLRA